MPIQNVGRVSFLYKGYYNPNMEYERYDIVLIKEQGLFHYMGKDGKKWPGDGTKWDDIPSDQICFHPEDEAGDSIKNYDWVLYLPDPDVYEFLKEHLKADNTIDITFYDEGDEEFNKHDILLNVNASALTFDSGTVSVDTFSPKSDINKGYDLTGKSVIDVVKELLCPYVLPTLVWATTPTDVWAGFGGSVTWAAKYEMGSNVKPYGWWDTVAEADREQLSADSPQTITKTISIPSTAPLGVYETHKYSVKDVGDNPKYEVVTIDAKSVTVKQPCFYWYSTTDDSNLTSISTTYAKKAAAKSTIENGRAITSAESGVLNWWYLVPTGTAINGFVQTDGVTPNSSKKVKSNIPIKIMNGTTECLTVYCDLWRSGQPLTVNAKFTNICK